jgi:glutaredoxin 2
MAIQIDRQRATKDRAIERELKRREVDLRRLTKEEKIAYYESRLEDTKHLNKEVSDRINALGAILTSATSYRGLRFDLFI